MKEELKHSRWHFDTSGFITTGDRKITKTQKQKVIEWLDQYVMKYEDTHNNNNSLSLVPDIIQKTITIGNNEILLEEPINYVYSFDEERELSNIIFLTRLQIGTKNRSIPTLLGSQVARLRSFAYYLSKKNRRSIYILKCREGLRFEEMLFSKIETVNNKIIYKASNLATAMLTGGICVLDEANRLNETTWADFNYFYDNPKTIKSLIGDIEFPVHPTFGIIALMNINKLPKYMESYIKSGFSSDTDNDSVPPNDTRSSEIPSSTSPILFEETVKFLNTLKTNGIFFDYSYNDIINIIRYIQRMEKSRNNPLKGIKKR